MKKKLVSLILVAAMLGTLIGCGSEPAGNGSTAYKRSQQAQIHRENRPSRLKHLKTRTSGR